MPTDRTYLVIADDSTQYGPISESDLRVWIRERRVQDHNQAWLEGSAEWKPLAEHPAFQGLFPPPPPRPRGAPTNAPPVQVPSDSGDGPAHCTENGCPVPVPNPNFLSRISQDAGPFVGIGKKFVCPGDCSGDCWIGPVVASPAALYLIKWRRERTHAHVHAHGDAPIVLLTAVVAIAKDVAEKVENKAKRAATDHFCNCTVADLPGDLRAEFAPDNTPLAFLFKYGGLPAKTLSDKPVVFIPKEVVTLVQPSKIEQLINIQVGADTYQLKTNIMQLFKTPRELEQLGWTLNRPLAPDSRALRDWRLLFQDHKYP